ncbi:MAG: type I pantothenate kinase, partial [Acidimicrobiia bacterium]|nr:type I pantothenate kinase [Acidimicrobiia bacterium]
MDSREVTSLLDGGLRERITGLHAISAPVVIGIAGSVAAGKSTFAAALVEGLSE